MTITSPSGCRRPIDHSSKRLTTISTTASCGHAGHRTLGLAASPLPQALHHADRQDLRLGPARPVSASAPALPSEQASRGPGAGDELRAARDGAAGATHLQIDEPIIRLPRTCVGARRRQRDCRFVSAHITLHVCSATATASVVEGSYRYLFPRILAPACRRVARVRPARRRDLRLFQEFDAPFPLGSASSTFKTHDVESRAGRRSHPPRARDHPGRKAGHQPRLRLRPPAARRRVQQARSDGRGHAHGSRGPVR